MKAGVGEQTADRAAVESYFRKYFSGLVRFLAGKVGDADQAADIAQAAFAKFAALEDPRRIGNPRAFLFATARNLVVDEARHAAVRRRHAEATLAEGLNGDADSHSPEEIALHRERLAMLKTVIERLPGKRRRVFILSRIHNLSLEEIAARERMSKRAVRGHIERALADIKAEMARAFDVRPNGKGGKEHNGKRRFEL